MPHAIIFRCSGCRARIKAPAALRGQARPCPGCGRRLLVQPRPVEDAGPALVGAAERPADRP
jgi:DNA-directed RNA polymerase subunit RPC12/RpoP